MIEFGHGTHVGLRRARNEDTYYADPELGLFLVADGMGGHQHGEVASALARETLVNLVGQGHALVDAVRRTDERLLATSQAMADALPMGTTVAALRVDAEDYEIAWVGDSRVYHWHARDGLKQVSHDHSLVQALVEAGTLDAGLASRHPRRNVLTQALGITSPEQLQIGMARGRREAGTSFLLCSDGLTEALDAPTIARIVARQDLAAQECADHLLLETLDRGAEDNVTVILARMR